MPTIKKQNVLVANATANPLVGSQYEYLPWDAKVEFAAFAIAANTAAATIYSGSDVLLEDTPLDVRVLADPIQYPYDVVVSDFAAAGERLNVQLRDLGAGSTVRTQVWITPI